MLQRIAIDDLTPGMYVNRVLDETGKVKVRSKGVVRSDAVINQLQCTHRGALFIQRSGTSQRNPTRQQR